MHPNLHLSFLTGLWLGTALGFAGFLFLALVRERVEQTRATVADTYDAGANDRALRSRLGAFVPAYVPGQGPTYAPILSDVDAAPESAVDLAFLRAD